MSDRRAQLAIFMNGYRVGLISIPPGGELRLDYDRQWQLSEGGRSLSLSLPLEQQVHRGIAVYNFLDNLLPDNPDIRQRIQRRFGCRTAHPFDLLAVIGTDCIGALQLIGGDSSVPDIRSIRATRLTDAEIARILQDYVAAPLGMGRNHDEFRISLAGAQEKTAFLWKDGSWHLPHGTTPTSHIVKLPIGISGNHGIDLSDSCENEWLCMKIAGSFGLAAAGVELRQFCGTKALVVTRFDRQWSNDNTWLMRLPQEDMCQALGCSPGLKYESDGGPGIISIMNLLQGSCSASDDRATFLRAQILFLLLAAIDGHAKNFSIRILPRSAFSLTPLYDILSAHPLFALNQLDVRKAKMAMALYGTTKKYYAFRQIGPRHLLATAKRAGYSMQMTRNHLDEMLGNLDGVIEQVASQIPSAFPAQIAEAVFKGMMNVRDAFVRDMKGNGNH